MRVFSLLAGQGLPVTSCSASRNNSPSDRVGHRHTDGDRLGLGAVDPISDRQQPPPRRADPVADAALVDVRLPAGWMASSGRGSKGVAFWATQSVGAGHASLAVGQVDAGMRLRRHPWLHLSRNRRGLGRARQPEPDPTAWPTSGQCRTKIIIYFDRLRWWNPRQNSGMCSLTDPRVPNGELQACRKCRK